MAVKQQSPGILKLETAEKEASCFQEHEPLRLLQILPRKAQRGLFSIDVEYTCIDVNHEYIVVGTSVGIVYLYDRPQQKLHKLSQNKQDATSCVAIGQGIDYVVAVGNIHGFVSVFQLPSSLPGRVKQLHVFCLDGLHVRKITCLEWSTNTEKLFSGDEDGSVVCSVMDYSKNQSRSFTVCEEPHPVVQLCYAHRILIISTTFRTILYANGKTRRVGMKDRKYLGDFGACFKMNAYKAEDVVLYCARPGLRLWLANIEGKVETTYQFRNLLCSDTPIINILPDDDSSSPERSGTSSDIQEANFGRLLCHGIQYLVTWYGGTFFIIDPQELKIIGWTNSLGHIQSVSVCDDEIFILRASSSRPIVRLTSTRDQRNQGIASPQLFTRSKGVSPTMPTASGELLQQTRELVSSGFLSAFQGVTDKTQDSQQVTSSPAVPPWGCAPEQHVTSLEDYSPDSCKEAISASSMSSSIQDNPDSPELIVSQTVAETVEVSQSSSAKEPAHVLDESELSQVDSVNVKESTSGEDPTPGQEQNMEAMQTAATIEDQRPTHRPVLLQVEEDIVYTSKQKKHKKKKKAKSTSRVQDDASSYDSVEIASVASYESGEECPQHTGNSSASGSPESSHREQTSSLGKADSPSGETGTEVHSVQLDEKAPSTEGLGTGEIELPPVRDIVSLIPNIAQMTVSAVDDNTQKDATHYKPELEGDDQHSSGNCDDTSVSVSEPHLAVSSYNGPDSLQWSHMHLLPSEAITEPSPLQDNVVPTFNDDMNQSSFESCDRVHRTIESETAADKDLTSTAASDDFFSKYSGGASSYSLGDIYSSPDSKQTIEESLDYSSSRTSKGDEIEVATADSERHSTEEALSSYKSVGEAVEVMHNAGQNMWTEALAPSTVQCLCLTDNHIWLVDKHDRIHYSSLSGPGLTWKKVEGSANQISVSRSGSIVWRLYHGSVYAGTKITLRSPAGSSWTEVVRKGVAYIAVDETSAWYIKANGDVMMQKGLSRDRPSYRSVQVPGKVALRQICCCSGITWAITEGNELIFRSGIDQAHEEGTEWLKAEGESATIKVSSLSLGEEGTAWVINLSGEVWSTTGVTKQRPAGSGHWWQVPVGGVVITDNLPVVMQARSEFPLSKLVSPAAGQGGVVTAGKHGVWMSLGSSNILSICRGSVVGYRWDSALLTGMASCAQWSLLSASAARKADGLIWAQQPNGGIFCFAPGSNKVTEVIQAHQQTESYVCVAAVKEAVWALTETGQVFVRSGMGIHCPQGLRWSKVDLMQLGTVKLVHLSCGPGNVWAVDDDGIIYLRIGNHPPDTSYLSPAWVPVEGNTGQTGTKFTKVFAGPLDWMVWAVDTKKCVFARKGVTDSMPIGTHWLYIPGTLAEDIALSGQLVYTLSPTGEVLIRYGVNEENPAGDFWKAVPGHLRNISVTACGSVWGISLDGRLCQQKNCTLRRSKELRDLRTIRSTPSISDDWEVI